MDLSLAIGSTHVSRLLSASGKTVTARVVQTTQFENKSQSQIQKDTEEKKRRIESIYETRKFAEKVHT